MTDITGIKARVRARLADNGRNAANQNAGIRVGSDLHCCEVLLAEVASLRAELAEAKRATSEMAIESVKNAARFQYDVRARQDADEIARLKEVVVHVAANNSTREVMVEKARAALAYRPQP